MEMEKFTEYYDQFTKDVYGFRNLIEMSQTLIVTYYMTVENYVYTKNMDQTLAVVKEVSDYYASMTNAWGYEK